MFQASDRNVEIMAFTVPGNIKQGLNTARVMGLVKTCVLDKFFLKNAKMCDAYKTFS